MRPRWYNLNDIPFDNMWPDDMFWFPWMLGGEQFYGYFTFRGLDTIVSHQLTAVSDFSSLTVPQGPSYLADGS